MIQALNKSIGVTIWEHCPLLSAENEKYQETLMLFTDFWQIICYAAYQKGVLCRWSQFWIFIWCIKAFLALKWYLIYQNWSRFKTSFPKSNILIKAFKLYNWKRIKYSYCFLQYFQNVFICKKSHTCKIPLFNMLHPISSLR